MKSLLLFFLCVVFSVGIIKTLDYFDSDTKVASNITDCYVFQFYTVPFTMLALNTCTGEHKEIILDKLHLFSFTSPELKATPQ